MDQKKRRVSSLGFVVAVLLWGPVSRPLPALDPSREIDQYAVEVFSTESGLPQSSILAMVQTHDGYIWLGTYEGLARFDGVRFTVFDRSNTPEMSSNGIKALLEDRDGTLWIGTAQGLLSYRDNRFRAYGAADGLKSEFILCLHQDWKGVLWVGTTYGLHRLIGDRFQVMTSRDGLSANYISALADDDQGRLWIGTGVGLNCLEKGSIRAYGTAEGLPHGDIRALYWDESGDLWIGTSGGGVARFRDGRFECLGMKAGLSSLDIRAIYRDRHGVLWIGTNEEPLNRLKGGVVTVLNRSQAGVLSARAILEDREGSLWVGTRDGLLQLRDDKFTLYSSRNGLPVDPVRAVFEDRDGDVWIGTIGGGLVRHRQTGWQVFGQAQGLRSDHVWSIAQSRDGSLWVGTYGGGLHRLQNNRFQVITTAQGLSNDIVRALLVDRRDRVWVGTNGGGLDCIENGRIVNYSTRSGLPGNYIYALGEDLAGRIWVGTYSGDLAVLEGNRFRSLRSPLLGSHPVWAIYPDRRGTVWVGTDHGGLLRIRDDRITCITTRDGLYSDQAFQILEDGENRLWMNCNKGISYVRKSDLEEFAAGRLQRISCVSFGKAEGIKVTESSGPAQPAGCIDRFNRIWFPTIHGVAIFDPSRLEANPIAPPLAIERVQIDGLDYPLRERAVAPPGSGNIEIDYTAISFLLVDKILFKYQLEGFDRDWIPVGTRRSAFYTNLPPGTYTFRVIACNGDDVWNYKGGAFSFVLRPHFYQTTSFRLLAVLTLLLLVAAGFLLALNRVRAREKRLARLVDQHTVELRQVNLLLEQSNRQLQHLARNDGLTELANHRTFYETFNREWAVAVREKRPLSLITVDIDYFKPYNDSCGHQQGDQCLRRVAAAIRAQVKRPGDLAARTGGEEFSILLPDTGSPGAMALAESIRRSVEGAAVPHPSSPVGPLVTVSLGVATTIPKAGEDSGKFVSLADQMLYRAKHEGRNRIGNQT